MTREIKFRVWTGKKMLSWDVLKNLKTVLLSKILSYMHLDCIPMQYTGLKDKNGVEIYEGDIVAQNSGSKYESIFEVDFRRGCFNVNQSTNSFLSTETIGNIYENPELLSQVK